MSSRKLDPESGNEPIRRSYEFDPELIAMVSEYAQEHSTALRPVTMAMVIDEALRDFFAKHTRPQLNGTAAHKKKISHTSN